jgi:hypothetical protein
MRRVSFKIAKVLGLAAGLAGVLAACAGGDKKSEDPHIFPKDYKTEITQLLTTTLEDPTNVRDAFITDPARGNAGNGPYYVCVRFNPRNANRAYKGSEDRIAYFYAGALNQLVAATPEQCSKASYKPFPELQKLCQSTSKCD